MVVGPKEKGGEEGCKVREGRGGMTPGNNKNCYETDSFAYILGGGKKGNRFFFYHYIRERWDLRLVKKGFFGWSVFLSFFFFCRCNSYSHQGFPPLRSTWYFSSQRIVKKGGASPHLPQNKEKNSPTTSLTRKNGKECTNQFPYFLSRRWSRWNIFFLKLGNKKTKGCKMTSHFWENLRKVFGASEAKKSVLKWHRGIL